MRAFHTTFFLNVKAIVALRQKLRMSTVVCLNGT
jgi:hypothetical protein